MRSERVYGLERRQTAGDCQLSLCVMPRVTVSLLALFFFFPPPIRPCFVWSQYTISFFSPPFFPLFCFFSKISESPMERTCRAMTNETTLTLAAALLGSTYFLYCKLLKSAKLRLPGGYSVDWQAVEVKVSAPQWQLVHYDAPKCRSLAGPTRSMEKRSNGEWVVRRAPALLPWNRHDPRHLPPRQKGQFPCVWWGDRVPFSLSFSLRTLFCYLIKIG